MASRVTSDFLKRVSALRRGEAGVIFRAMSPGLTPKPGSNQKSSLAPRGSDHGLTPDILDATSFSKSAIINTPMPLTHLAPTKWLSKLLLLLVGNKVVEIRGLRHIDPSMDPFILALNHSQKLEALYIPALLHFLRKGKLIHFLADWNFCLVPGIWLFYYYGEVITVARKPARPRFLNVLKPMFVKGQGSFDQALHCLESKRSLGVFPEGTTNRQPDVLLKGYSGVAQMSLKTGVPVVPAGIRFPNHDKTRMIPESIPFSIEFGEPLYPGEQHQKPSLKKLRDFHVEIMSAISRLSGKAWNRQQRKK